MDQFDLALQGYIIQANQLITAYYAQAYKDTSPDFREKQIARAMLQMKKGRKYVKFVSDGSVHSFVGKETGDVYKPASFRAPALHARGNIYKNNGIDALTPQGRVRYL
jgi:hypothetical protein